MTELAPKTRRGPDDETEAARLMVPAKPFRLVRFRNALLDEPCGIVRDVGLAEMLKSAGETLVTVNDPIPLWVRDPLVPVIV